MNKIIQLCIVQACFLILLVQVNKTKACSGCTFEDREERVKFCSKTSKKYMKIDYNTISVDDDCNMNTNLTVKVIKPIDTFKLSLKGSFGMMPVSFQSVNGCKLIKVLEKDRIFGKLFKYGFGGVKNCPFVVGTLIKPQVTEIEPAHQHLFKLAQGKLHLKIELKKVNGGSDTICIDYRSELTCSLLKMLN